MNLNELQSQSWTGTLSEFLPMILFVLVVSYIARRLKSGNQNTPFSGTNNSVQDKLNNKNQLNERNNSSIKNNKPVKISSVYDAPYKRESGQWTHAIKWGKNKTSKEDIVMKTSIITSNNKTFTCFGENITAIVRNQRGKTIDVQKDSVIINIKGQNYRFQLTGDIS